MHKSMYGSLIAAAATLGRAVGISSGAEVPSRPPTSQRKQSSSRPRYHKPSMAERMDARFQAKHKRK